MAEVAKHNTEGDCWIVVEKSKVLDMTQFMSDHPGGKRVVMLYAGRDATEEFHMLHKPDLLAKYLKTGEVKLVGTVEGVITKEEVAKHNTEGDCWIIVEKNKVLDMTQFLAEHPGGKRVVMLYAGKDASWVAETEDWEYNTPCCFGCNPRGFQG